MGIIKGSIPRDGEYRCLSREEYLGLGIKMAPTFLPEERKDIYDIYLRYEKFKSRYGDQDGIDRVIALLNYLKDADAASKRALDGVVEEIYVDEVQDLRCIDIALLLKIVRNPCGIHFAGDSAQCISMDSTFRFSDLKAMFYKEFIQAAKESGDPRMARPEVFKLTKNFRSHQGIISLASFVMNLLYKGRLCDSQLHSYLPTTKLTIPKDFPKWLTGWMRGERMTGPDQRYLLGWVLMSARRSWRVPRIRLGTLEILAQGR